MFGCRKYIQQYYSTFKVLLQYLVITLNVVLIHENPWLLILHQVQKPFISTQCVYFVVNPLIPAEQKGEPWFPGSWEADLSSARRNRFIPQNKCKDNSPPLALCCHVVLESVCVCVLCAVCVSTRMCVQVYVWLQ